MQKGVQQDARMSAPGLALGKQAKRQNDQWITLPKSIANQPKCCVVDA